jgi:hypothetical protein
MIGRRMHGRLLPRRGLAAFAFLVVVTEVAGRSLTTRVDRLFHVEPLAPTGANYYPLLLVALKILAALGCAALLARATRARAAADAGERLLAALDHRHQRSTPRFRPGLSPRVWLAAFVSTSAVYLVHADAEQAAAGRWPLLAPWLHTYALPTFAVLAVAVALLWSVAGWLYEVEEYAARTIDRARRMLRAAISVLSPPHPRVSDADAGPRLRFGLAFESRPPPVLA